MKFITAFFMAWGNFITLPCPSRKWDGKLKNLMLAMLPSVGIVVGVLFFVLMGAAEKLRLPDMVTAIVAEFYMFYIHGFMHLDGFMDCTDAIMSRRDLEERQRIMKDPTVGSFAVVMVCFLLITWFACFYTVASKYWTLVYAIAFIPVISRASAGYQVLKYKPLGHSQYVEDFEEANRGKCRVVTLVQLAVYMLLFYFAIYYLIRMSSDFMYKMWAVHFAAAVVTGFAGAHARKQLGGMSGDIAGYSIIWGELAGIVAAAVCTAY